MFHFIRFTFAISFLIVVAHASLPNIVVVIIDDWGWNNWGIHAKNQLNYNEVVTPNLDRLATEGIILDRHYTPRMCGPSRNTFFTGRNPIHNSGSNGDMGAYNLTDRVGGYEGSPTKMTFIPKKLASAGYKTAMFGKWDTGQATPTHYPIGRGFDYALTFSSYTVDPWTYRVGPPDTPSFGMSLDPYYTYFDLMLNDKPAYHMMPNRTCSFENQMPGCTYIDDLFATEAVEYIQNHNTSDPLFLTFAPHAIHTPLNVPNNLADEFNAYIDYDSRANYSASVCKTDLLVESIVDALKSKDMWNNTLMLVFSDNGGPIYMQVKRTGVVPFDGGANNYPLRGGKLSNYEGGIRVNAFLSGGAIPIARRGTTEEGFIANEDWYGTFCAIAGVDQHDDLAASYGLPDVDSINMLPLIMGETQVSPREELYFTAALPLSTGVTGGQNWVQSIINKDGFKLTVGFQAENVRQVPFYPNSTVWSEYDPKYQDVTCYGGPDQDYPTFDEELQTYVGACLYNILTDPEERYNISGSNQDLVQQLSIKMNELSKNAYNPDRGVATAYPATVLDTNWGNSMGPWLFESLDEI